MKHSYIIPQMEVVETEALIMQDTSMAIFNDAANVIESPEEILSRIQQETFILE